MQVKRAKILYEHGTIKRIAEYFLREKGKRLSHQTIRNALRFVTSGDQPEEIRKIAIEKFGAVPINEYVEL